MTRSTLLLLSLLPLLASCGNESTPATETTDMRTPIAVEYVAAPQLKVQAKPDPGSPLLTTYQNGETVSVLSNRGEWAEVRTATGSGWAKASELEAAPATQTPPADNLTLRFRKPPAPVTQTSSHGEIVLEASVSPQGEVTAVRTLSNSTGSVALEYKNTQELKQAKFYPMIRHGQHIPFVYEYRVHY
jgi:TonB family protein